MTGKMIYRTEKVNTAGECSGREHEANRTIEDRGKFQNSDINWELTNSNYNFKTTHNWVEAVKEKCKELGCPVKKDSVLVLDHLITASPDWMKQQTEETKMAFFEDAVKWVVDEFCGGDESLLLNATIHKDESNWHLAAATIPIMKNPERSEEELAKLKRKPRQKEYSLNAKAIVGGRGKMSSRQQSIEEKIGKKYGLEEREVREQGECKKHKTVQQAKLDAVKEEVREAEQKVQALNNLIKDKTETVRKYNKAAKTYNDLVAKLGNLEKDYNEAYKQYELLKEENEKREKYNDGLIEEEKDLKTKIENLEKSPGLEAIKNRNKVAALEKICLGVNEYGESYSLGEFITEARKHSSNMSEFQEKMETVLFSLNNVPINDLFQYVKNKGRLHNLDRDERDEL